MTNKIAIVLGLLIVGIFAADLFVFGWDLHIFLGKKLMVLTEYMAFWR
ncbi:hypothetical protein SAMN05444273_101159 [Litoreibacter ascidiaceicola]|uniref:Uncharacterized protein n=1 Tax=Litoreibacter ascidiaceicola TaxID=1486859 RepID=A0A1M4SQZ2_9RHOB|nr:hypothetical protein [Litoreibacter ascidiaceicola]SHE34589.1 hypothetical protein SAMN05444273_101159 [Litoreibacter ascidiaceicola]